MTMRTIVQQYLTDFMTKKDKATVVPDSFPIVWFGDVDAYQQSPQRIVTVGTNPSNQEFEIPADGQPRFQFRGPVTLQAQPDDLIADYNRYFKNTNNPFTNWFNGQNKELKYFDASYYDDQLPKTAVHIDYETGIATRRGWSGLSSKRQSELANHELFIELVQELNPEILIVQNSFEVVQQIVAQLGEPSVQPTFIEPKTGQVLPQMTYEKKVTTVGVYQLVSGMTIVWVAKTQGNNRIYGHAVAQYLQNQSR